MKRLLVLMAIVLTSFWVVFSQSPNTSEWLMTENGWGDVKIGQSVDQVDEILGKPTRQSPVGDMIFADYAWSSVLFVYVSDTHRLGAIYFDNRTTLKDKNALLFRTDAGISWNSTEDDVVRAYGTPLKIKASTNRRRLIYRAMQFLFIKNRLTAVCVNDGKGSWTLE